CAKWTCQLSLGSTLPRAAAMPPSAMTVWALPSSDLQTRVTDSPEEAAAIAARRPAPPAPITRTSWSNVSYRPASARPATTRLRGSLEDPGVRNRAGHQQPDIDVGGDHREQAGPRPPGMAMVERVHPLPQPEPQTAAPGAGVAVEVASHHVAERVAPERVAREEDDVHQEDQGAQVNVVLLSGYTLGCHAFRHMVGGNLD